MPNTFELIASSTVGSGGSATISFTSIASTWTDLVLKVSGRTSWASGDDAIVIKFNGSSSTYSMRRLDGNGSTATSNNNALSIRAVTNDAIKTASTFGSWEIYIPNYAGSANKSASLDAVSENNATAANANLVAGLWSTTSAITQIDLTSFNSANFVQHSSAYLYGVKNA
jgi:hypothetical protein